MSTLGGPPRRIGRYHVLELLGEGGMGQVYLAHDPSLDRKVAIKLLRKRSGPARGEAQHRQQLLREAKALAQLDHPNVLPVFDVGIVDDEVFLAAEYVEGETLLDWQQERTNSEIVEAYRGAGRGLAAAHRVGILHCDFKPANAIVGDSGGPRVEDRIRVLDFGLARTVRESRSSADSEVEELSRTAENLLGTLISHDGMVFGTPMYMAPEQHVGKALDPRTDQYAFCACLYEALAGVRPFAGDYRELIRHKFAGQLTPPPASRTIDARLLEVLRRGLAPVADDRWPSMEALLAALEPRSRRRFGLLVVGAATVLAAVTLLPDDRPAAVCDPARHGLDDVWGPPQRAAVRDALLATGAPHAPATWARLEPRLDGFAAAWTAARQDVCTALSSESAEMAFDVRMACLDERKRQLASLVEVLSRSDAPMVDRAIEAVEAVPAPGECLAATVDDSDMAGPSTGPGATKFRERMAWIEALYRAGRYEEGSRDLRNLWSASKPLEYAPAEADLALWRGRFESARGQFEAASESYAAAYWAATSARRDETAFEAAVLLVLVNGNNLAQFDEGHRWAREAEAALSRVEATAERRSDLDNAIGVLLDAEGRYEEARDYLVRALDKRPESSLSRADTATNLGLVLLHQGRYEEAEPAYRQATKVYEDMLGAEHPRYGSVLRQLGATIASQGRYEDAIVELERSLAIHRRALDPDHPEIATTLSNIGSSMLFLGRYEEAQEHYERALAIVERSLGPNHPTTAALHLNLGLLSSEQGDRKAARGWYEQALAIYETTLGPDHPEVGRTLNNLASIAFDQRRFGESQRLYERSLVLFESAGEPDNVDLVYPLTGLGRAHAAQEDWWTARPLLERALAIGSATDPEPRILADTRFALAKSLRGAGVEPQRSRELAEAARDLLEEYGDPSAAAGVQRWLRDLSAGPRKGRRVELKDPTADRRPRRD